MTVDRDKLVRMGEQVAANLVFDDDAEGLVARVTDHLTRFWDPRMKEAIKDHLASGNAEVSDTLRAAVSRLA